MQPKRAPQKRSKHKKHIGHHILGTYGVVALAMVSVGALAGAAYLSSSSLGGTMASVISSTLVDLTNGDRASDHLGTLTVSPVLTAAAQAKANDMAAKGYFAHTSPDGKNSWYWFKLEGYAFTYAGENLAVDFTDSHAVEEAWMNSPTHRANILNGHFTQIGIATAMGTYEGHKTTFVVQMFGTPTSAQGAQVQAVNPSPAPTELAVAKSVPVKQVTKPVQRPAATSATTSAATTTPAPAGQEPASPQNTPGNPVEMLAAAPVLSLRNLYLVIGALVLAALVSITGLEFQRRHMRYVAAAAFLLVLMGGLYLAADKLIFTSPTLTASAAAALPE